MTNPRLPPLLVNKVKRVPFFTCIPTKMFGTEISSGAKEESQKNRKGSWRTKGWRNLF